LYHHHHHYDYYYSKNGKVQKRGKLNLIGRLQLSTEKSKEEDNEGIMQLRILRVQVRPFLPIMEIQKFTKYSQY
jgi:cullin-5